MGLVTVATTVGDARCWLRYVEDLRSALEAGGPHLQPQVLEGLVPVPGALHDLLDRVEVVAGRAVDEPAAIGLPESELLEPLVFALVAVQVWATALARDGALPASAPAGAWRFLRALEDAAGLAGRSARALAAMGLDAVDVLPVVSVGAPA